jgi:hypothetical protein
MSRRTAAKAADRKLSDRLALDRDLHGEVLGLLATTFELEPNFFETDLLPTLLGLGAWDDKALASRVAMEQSLAKMVGAAVVMAAGRYRGRPRSLRVELTPLHLAPRKLHAKIVLVLYERVLRFVVSSANLTTQGYRHNREVAVAFEVSEARPEQGPLVRSALENAPTVLQAAWSESARVVRTQVLERLEEWGVGDAVPGERFLWGGGETLLWEDFLADWPGGEPVHKVIVASPFWSEERGEGPLSTFLGRLHTVGLLAPKTDIQLLTEAVGSANEGYKPLLPDSLARLDLSSLGVRPTAQSVDPSVLPEEVGGRDDFIRTRPLHAKVVLLEGSDTSLAYVGSANFTRRGFGFFPSPSLANIEAGLALRRTGTARASLRSIVPSGTGPKVSLGGGAVEHVSVVVKDDLDPRWPSFLPAVWLVPRADDPDALRLVAEVSRDHVAGPWSLWIGEKIGQPLLACTGQEHVDEPLSAELHMDQVNDLLRLREVLVTWWEHEEGTQFPINVTLPARERLPVAPGGERPGEDQLLAYYQGRIAFEDMFWNPDDEEENQDRERGTMSEESGVDTSRIQSYKVRAFVEALQGIKDDLKAATVSEPALRLALRGPVSPVALAREVCRAVRAKDRSATAGGFQLVEILVCIEEARGFPVPERLFEAWLSNVAKASEEVATLLDGLRREHGDELAPTTGFGRYEAKVRERAALRQGGVR